MATYYDFPSPVTLTEGDRLYLKEVKFTYAPVNGAELPRRLLEFRLTDSAGTERDVIEFTVSEVQWTNFVANFAVLPGLDFEEKLLLQMPALIAFVPAGGSIQQDA